MRYISKEDWNKIPKDYKSVWNSDEIRGTKHNGKNTWMVGENGMMVLLIEGSGFKIVEPDNDNIIEVECNECGGSGSVAFEDDSYLSPSYNYHRCEECCGDGTIETYYDGY